MALERYPTPDMGSYAGMLDRRFEAYFIDGLVVMLILGVLGFLAGGLFLSSAGAGLGGAYVTIIFGIIPAAGLYKIAIEGYYGTTIGKHLRGIVVVKRDGSKMTWEASLIRNLLRIVDAFPAFYLVGLLSGYTSDDNQRLGDRLGDTVVVYRAA